ncbi:hypothetical protein [Microbacterium sp. NIBRBAC000506063]|uniref:hypothetical protein n=1 Tax=Microbacterium sp. NIBRBAC000506063 TaxID=2734618 RepID=UPI001BB59D27|nr:hypothetical protein [Microbacterium sp. NIBRBAC000506063]QTV79464.1 hypothetical protein KAE78_11210 [Microbacterium sp. NIBRBAC000506063]
MGRRHRPHRSAARGPRGRPTLAGSHEQILLAWSRELAAADAAAPHGLNQDALRFTLHKVTRIRDLIRDFFDPPRTGDIPKARCPSCDETTALALVDGDWIPVPAIGWIHTTGDGLEAFCRNCDRRWSGELLHLMDRFKWAQRRPARVRDLTTPLTGDDWTHIRLDLREAAQDPSDINVWQQPGVTTSHTEREDTE